MIVRDLLRSSFTRAPIWNCEISTRSMSRCIDPLYRIIRVAAALAQVRVPPRIPGWSVPERNLMSAVEMESDRKPTPPIVAVRPRDGIAFSFKDYFWFILKNVIGWIFILISPGVGVLLPGPGGIPLFLIGFALVTFPGKRRITSRVLRGRRLPLESGIFTIVTATVSLLITSALIWYFGAQYQNLLKRFSLIPSIDDVMIIGGICLLAFVVTWLVTRLMLQVLNFFLRKMPLIRRFMRRTLRRYGINLLPSRRKRGLEGAQATEINDEILGFDEHHHTRMRRTWAFLQPWLKRTATVAIVLTIFWRMVKPLRENWPKVRNEVWQTDPWRFLLASVMFAIFLYAFRAMSWRRVLKGFGYKLPRGAATRIFATSELARYVPGAVLQVIGRAYLAKPYGIPTAISSTTQILELCIFLFANVIMATACLLWFGAKIDPHARPWLITALALCPRWRSCSIRSSFTVSPTGSSASSSAPRSRSACAGKKLVLLLGWVLVGLLWQSLAVWIITAPQLGLKLDWWWAVAGSYCLAWCAGFLMVLSPGGLGVREVVFFWTMKSVIRHLNLPSEVHTSFNTPAVLDAYLIFLGFLLRLWTIVGELLVTVFSYIWDLGGAMNHPDAPKAIISSKLKAASAPPGGD